MKDTHADLNRPVHLARRDVFFERAVDLLGLPLDSVLQEARAQHVSHVLSALRCARQHAIFAGRSGAMTPREKDFVRFLDLKFNNVLSAEAMMQHQAALEESKSALCRFLEAPPERCELPALHFQRRAEDILLGLWHILQSAQAPYRALQQANYEALTPRDQERYLRACRCTRDEAAAMFPPAVLAERPEVVAG